MQCSRPTSPGVRSLAVSCQFQDMVHGLACIVFPLRVHLAMKGWREDVILERREDFIEVRTECMQVVFCEIVQSSQGLPFQSLPRHACVGLGAHVVRKWSPVCDACSFRQHRFSFLSDGRYFPARVAFTACKQSRENILAEQSSKPSPRQSQTPDVMSLWLEIGAGTCI